MHKNLLDLPIQQERLGPRLACKFFLGSCLGDLPNHRICYQPPDLVPFQTVMGITFEVIYAHIRLANSVDTRRLTYLTGSCLYPLKIELAQ